MHNCTVAIKMATTYLGYVKSKKENYTRLVDEISALPKVQRNVTHRKDFKL